MPHASISSGTAPRLETASTTTCAPDGRVASANACRSETTPVEVSECVRKTARTPSVSASSALEIGGRRHLAPRVAERHHVARRTARRSPPTARRRRLRRRRPRAVPGLQRLATADSIAPVPEAVNSSASDDVRQISFSRGEALGVDRAEVRAAVVDDRLGKRGEHLGRHRRRPRREEIALRGHGAEPSSARSAGSLR